MDIADGIDPRAQVLIERLGMVRHVEGGWYCEHFHAEDAVTPWDGRGERRALSAIYYLLAGGQVSRWHRVASPEAWHYHEGGVLELLVMDPGMTAVTRHHLGPVDGEARSLVVVPPGWWQAARPAGAYTLAGCCCGPCFDARDFQLMADAPGAAAFLEEHHPDLAPLL